jgi:hypothetical protein
MADLSVAEYIGKLLIKSFDGIEDPFILFLEFREKALYVWRKARLDQDYP